MLDAIKIVGYYLDHGWVTVCISIYNQINSAFHSFGVGKSSTGLSGWGYGGSRSPVAGTCVIPDGRWCAIDLRWRAIPFNHYQNPRHSCTYLYPMVQNKWNTTPRETVQCASPCGLTEISAAERQQPTAAAAAIHHASRHLLCFLSRLHHKPITLRH